MEQRQLGKSCLHVSVVGMGAWKTFERVAPPVPKCLREASVPPAEGRWCDPVSRSSWQRPGMTLLGMGWGGTLMSLRSWQLKSSPMQLWGSGS
jgi:hypothetical protein